MNENISGKVVVITGASSGWASHKVGVNNGCFARAVAFAISEPEDVDTNEILFRPTRQEL